MKKALVSLLILWMFSGCASRSAFVAVGAAVVVSSAADAHSTIRCSRELSGEEANPFMRPIVEAGPVALGGFTLLVDVGILRRAYKDFKAGNRGWWVTPLIFSATHTYGAQHNYRLLQQERENNKDR